jgi:hypothetical protein
MTPGHIYDVYSVWRKCMTMLDAQEKGKTMTIECSSVEACQK